MVSLATSWTMALKAAKEGTLSLLISKKFVGLTYVRLRLEIRSATRTATRMLVDGTEATAPSISTILGRIAPRPCSAGSILTMANATPSATTQDASMTVLTARTLTTSAIPSTTSIARTTSRMVTATKAVTMRSVSGMVWTVLIICLRSWPMAPWYW